MVFDDKAVVAQRVFQAGGVAAVFAGQPCGAGGGLEAVCTGKQYGETAGVEVEFGRAEVFVFDDFVRVLLRRAGFMLGFLVNRVGGV